MGLSYCVAKAAEDGSGRREDEVEEEEEEQCRAIFNYGLLMVGLTGLAGLACSYVAECSFRPVHGSGSGPGVTGLRAALRQDNARLDVMHPNQSPTKTAPGRGGALYASSHIFMQFTGVRYRAHHRQPNDCRCHRSEPPQRHARHLAQESGTAEGGHMRCNWP